MAKLMMSEIHGLRFLERDRTYLIMGRKLTSVVAFSLLKSTEKNEVTMAELFKFLTDSGYSPTENDINAIFWRLDHNKDGKLTYQDFCVIYDDSACQKILPEGTQIEAELLPRDENDNPILPPDFGKDFKPPLSEKGSSVKGSVKSKKSTSKKSNVSQKKQSGLPTENLMLKLSSKSS